MFSTWRRITRAGMITAAKISGHRLVNCQSGFMIMAATSASGKATAAAIEAKETYLKIRTRTVQTTNSSSFEL